MANLNPKHWSLRTRRTSGSLAAVLATVGLGAVARSGEQKPNGPEELQHYATSHMDVKATAGKLPNGISQPRHQIGIERVKGGFAAWVIATLDEPVHELEIAVTGDQGSSLALLPVPTTVFKSADGRYTVAARSPVFQAGEGENLDVTALPAGDVKLLMLGTASLPTSGQELAGGPGADFTP